MLCFIPDRDSFGILVVGGFFYYQKLLSVASELVSVWTNCHSVWPLLFCSSQTFSAIDAQTGEKMLSSYSCFFPFLRCRFSHMFSFRPGRGKNAFSARVKPDALLCWESSLNIRRYAGKMIHYGMKEQRFGIHTYISLPDKFGACAKRNYFSPRTIHFFTLCFFRRCISLPSCIELYFREQRKWINHVLFFSRAVCVDEIIAHRLISFLLRNV